MENNPTDITAVLSSTQRRQLAGLVKRLQLYGAGQLEIVIERGAIKRYCLSKDPIEPDLSVEVSGDEFERLFRDDWPWWGSLAMAIQSVESCPSRYGSIFIEVEGGHVHAVREAQHIPALPGTGPLENDALHK